MKPTEILPLDKNNFEPYTRVGKDNSGWINGKTPINAENLNNGDVALSNLLKEADGYIYQLIEKLNAEISGRLIDVKSLNSEISTLNENGVKSGDELIINCGGSTDNMFN